MTVPGLIAGSFVALFNGGMVVLIVGVASTLITGRNNTGVDGIGLIMFAVGVGGLFAWRLWFRRSSISPSPAEGRERG